MKKRLEWSIKHKNFTVEDWSNVLWSDESNFEVFSTPGVSFVRRRVGEEYNPECVIPTVKHGGGSIMIWGCMAASGVGEMFICRGRMDSKTYIQVLETTLMPSFQSIFGETNLRGVTFQQDNAPCHTSAFSRNWLTENAIPLLDWPAQSLDLNLIEHLWGILKKKIRKLPITSKKSLEVALREQWQKITAEECHKLVASMPKRVAAVIKSRGGPTKY